MPRVEIPSYGTYIDFPDGIDQAVMMDVLAKNFPKKSGSAYVGDTSGRNVSDMEKEFIAKEGKPQTLGAKVKDYLVGQTEPATSLGDFAGRVLPESARKLIPRIAMAGYEAIKGQTDPLIESLSTLKPSGLPGPKMEANAGKTVMGLAQGMSAPVGLMGLGAAKEAWMTDPIMSAMAVIPVAKALKGAPRGLADLGVKVAEATTTSRNAAAKKLTDMTLKQGTTLDRKVRDQNVKTALEGNFQPTSKGVDKLNAAIADTELKLKEGIASGDAAKVKGTLDKATANIEGLREQANRSSDPAANNKLIDAELERLQNHPLLDESGKVDIGTLQKMKVEQGRELQKTYGAEKPQFQNTIDKARVRGFKEELETSLDGAFPELSATNKQLGEFYQLKKSLERAANRIEGNQGVGIALPIKGGAGATIGGMIAGPAGAAVGGGIGTLIGIIEHPSVAPRLAQALYRSQKGKMTMKEAKTTTNGRLDAIKASLTAKLKDELGLVGKDINAGKLEKGGFTYTDEGLGSYVVRDKNGKEAGRADLANDGKGD